MEARCVLELKGTARSDVVFICFFARVVQVRFILRHLTEQSFHEQDLLYQSTEDNGHLHFYKISQLGRYSNSRQTIHGKTRRKKVISSAERSGPSWLPQASPVPRRIDTFPTSRKFLQHTFSLYHVFISLSSLLVRNPPKPPCSRGINHPAIGKNRFHNLQA